MTFQRFVEATGRRSLGNHDQHSAASLTVQIPLHIRPDTSSVFGVKNQAMENKKQIFEHHKIVVYIIILHTKSYEKHSRYNNDTTAIMNLRKFPIEMHDEAA